MKQNNYGQNTGRFILNTCLCNLLSLSATYNWIICAFESCIKDSMLCIIAEMCYGHHIIYVWGPLSTIKPMKTQPHFVPLPYFKEKMDFIGPRASWRHETYCKCFYFLGHRSHMRVGTLSTWLHYWHLTPSTVPGPQWALNKCCINNYQLIFWKEIWYLWWLILCVNLARTRYLDIWWSSIFNVAVKLYLSKISI